MLTVLDIGVRGGPHPRWFPFGSKVHVIGIDADPEECARLSRLSSPVRTSYLSCAVGAQDNATATLYITRQPGCSSLLPPNHALLSHFPYGEQFTIERTTTVTLVSLDTICARHHIAPDVIKMDVQGAELAVIEGGARVFDRALLVETEVEFNPIYQAQPLLPDIDRALRAQGFLLLGLRRTVWRRSTEGPAGGGTLIHGDALYVRDPQPSDRVRRRHLAMALSAYQQWDLVATLAPDLLPNRPVALFGRLMARVHTHRHWRAWLDQHRAPGAIDWHDPAFY